jgi:hypothetical protein
MARQLIATPKLVVTIFWGVLGICIIDDLPRGSSFESTDFMDHVLKEFQNLPLLVVAEKMTKGFVIQMDNSPIHRSESLMAAISAMPIHSRRIRHARRGCENLIHLKP